MTSARPTRRSHPAARRVARAARIADASAAYAGTLTLDGMSVLCLHKPVARNLAQGGTTSALASESRMHTPRWNSRGTRIA